MKLLNQEINNFLRTEDGKKRIGNLGATPTPQSAEDFKVLFDEDLLRFGKLVRQLAIGVD